MQEHYLQSQKTWEKFWTGLSSLFQIVPPKWVLWCIQKCLVQCLDLSVVNRCDFYNWLKILEKCNIYGIFLAKIILGNRLCPNTELISSLWGRCTFRPWSPLLSEVGFKNPWFYAFWVCCLSNSETLKNSLMISFSLSWLLCLTLMFWTFRILCLYKVGALNPTLYFFQWDIHLWKTFHHINIEVLLSFLGMPWYSFHWMLATRLLCFP